MGVTLVDSYADANRSTDLYCPEYDGSEIGQSFNPSASGPLTSFKFLLSKAGTPTGNMRAKLYAHTGTYGTATGLPTGAALATSNTIACSTLTTTPTSIEFVFATPYSVVASTKYYVVVSPDAQTSGNNVLVGVDGSSPSHAGTWAGWFTDHWWTDAADDCCFYAYVTSGDIKKIAGVAIADVKVVRPEVIAHCKKIAGEAP